MNGRPTVRQVLTRMQLRVSLFAVGLTGLTVLLTGFVAIGTYAERNLDLVARSASHSVEPAIVFDDAEAARDGIRSLLLPGVARIEVIDINGHLLGNLSREAGRSGPARSLADILFFREPVEQPVMHLGHTIGVVRVQGEGSVVADYIRAALFDTIACMVITALATHLLARRLRSEIVEPLAEIATATHRFRRDQALDQLAPEASIREIEELRLDFNALIAELSDWRQNLRTENETLSHRASHDTLTGLPNRALFEQRLAEMIAEARTNDTTFVLLYADGNRFKAVNDRYGHASGDVVLVEIAARLRACLRARDMAARLGGDEFAILLAAPSGPDAADRVCQELESRMAEPIALPSGVQVTVGLSIGQASFPRDGTDLRLLLNHADNSMYARKGAYPGQKEV